MTEWWSREYLLREVLEDEFEVERMLEDDDLWVVVPEARWSGGTWQEHIRGLEEAARTMKALVFFFQKTGNVPAMHVVMDASERAEEALRRAKRRAGYEEAAGA